MTKWHTAYITEIQDFHFIRRNTNTKIRFYEPTNRNRCVCTYHIAYWKKWESKWDFLIFSSIWNLKTKIKNILHRKFKETYRTKIFMIFQQFLLFVCNWLSLNVTNKRNKTKKLQKNFLILRKTVRSRDIMQTYSLLHIVSIGCIEFCLHCIKIWSVC